MTAAVGDPEDVVKEIVDPLTPRVDAVFGPATGTPFLILKSLTAVRKADDVTELDPTDDPMDIADPDAAGLPVPTDAAGDAAEPGSPAWEALDAAHGRAATSQLLALKNIVEALADREATEASAGLADGDMNAMDLSDVCSAIDFAVAVMAKYAVDEQDESVTAQADIEDAARDLGLIKGLVVDTDQLVAIAKAGRVLSGKNESALRSAAESINNVLASLPAATEETPVAKSTDELLDDALRVRKDQPGGEADPTAPAVTDTDGNAAAVALDTPPEAAATDQTDVPVVKAGKPQVAVFDADGKLVGTVDPVNLNPIAAATPPAGGDAQGGAADPAAVAADPAAVAAPTDPAAAPAADDETAVAKALAVPGVQAAIEKAIKEVLEPLQDRIEKMERAPAVDATLMSGVLPAGLPDGNANTAASSEVIALQKALDAETRPGFRERLKLELAELMIRERVRSR